MGKYTGQEAKVGGQVGDEREAAYRVKTGKTRRKGENPETRTEMSMATYATCLRANKFLVRAANCGGGIRRATRFRSVYAKGDETGRGRQRTNFVLGDDGKNEKGKEDPFTLFLTLSCHIREYAKSFPTTSDTHEEYCNHVPEEKAKERGVVEERVENANFGRKAPLCATISRLFEKRPWESVICMRQISVAVSIFRNYNA